VTERLSTTYKRTEFTVSVRRAAWARCGGHCEGCGKSLHPDPNTMIPHVFDHIWPQRLDGTSDLANCQVLCDDGPDSCNRKKTMGLDLPGIAARKRHEKGRLALDIDRPVRKPGKIAGRPMPKSSRKIPSRPMRAK
jgi:5-methylcytosine-specific restriction endonuclease McrA